MTKKSQRMERQVLEVKLKTLQNRYSESFKKQVVSDYERGFLNKDQIKGKYNLPGNSTVLEWCRKYGKLVYEKKSTPAGRPMKDPQKQRIKELERALKEAELKVKLYEKIIEIAERDEGIPITKKYGAMQSEKPQKPEQE